MGPQTVIYIYKCIREFVFIVIFDDHKNKSQCTISILQNLNGRLLNCNVCDVSIHSNIYDVIKDEKYVSVTQ